MSIFHIHLAEISVLNQRVHIASNRLVCVSMWFPSIVQYYTKKNIFFHTQIHSCVLFVLLFWIYTQSIVGNNNNSKHAIIYKTSSSRAQEPNLITSFSFKCSPTLSPLSLSSELSCGRRMSFPHICRKCLRLHFLKNQLGFSDFPFVCPFNICH